MALKPQELEDTLFALEERTEFAEAHRTLRMKHLSRLRATEDQIVQYADEANFHSFLAYLLTDLDFTPEEIADQLRTSTANVSRWRNVKSTPPAHSRYSMVKSLLELAEHRFQAS